jgi:lipopolysaccharide export system protein LptC
MPAELHLPDLPEVPISIGGARAPGPPRPALPWHLRLRGALATYLPLLLMAALALASWWLVRNAPAPPAERPPAAQRTAPDYTMHRFVVQRFGADGRLRLQLEGRELRHYAAAGAGATERIEVDQVDLRAWSPDGRLTTATARRAVSNGDGSRVQLEGGAELLGSDAQGGQIEVRSEFLEALLAEGIVRTDQPVQVLHGTQRLSAGGLIYERDRGMLRFAGPVRAVLRGPAR